MARQPRRRNMPHFVEVVGQEALGEGFAEISKTARRGVATRALAAAGKLIQKEAKRLAPKLSGRLRKSVKVKRLKLPDPGKAAYARIMKAGGTKSQAQAALKSVRKANSGKLAASVEVGAEAHHAHLVEFGTVNQSAQPFLRPAIRKLRPQILSQISDILRAELDKTIIRARKRAAAKLAREEAAAKARMRR